MPENIKPVLDAIVQVFDALNRMNRGEIFETLEILKSDNSLARQIELLANQKLSFQKILEELLEQVGSDLRPLFEESLKIQMAAILYTKEEKDEAIARWESHLFSKGMNIHRLSSAEFEKLNPSSETRADNRFKNASAAMTAAVSDLERMWLGMTHRHVCILVDGKRLYRLNSMTNIFEPTFVPVEATKENIHALGMLLPKANQVISLDADQIKSCIGHRALSNSFSSERFEWEYKDKGNIFMNSFLFIFNNKVKNSIRPLDVLGVIYDDLLVYLGDIQSDKHKLYNLAAFIITIALLSLATTAVIGLFLSTPIGWGTLGAIILAGWIFTGTAMISRGLNLIGWYFTHNPADNPNSEEFLSAESRFRLTPDEEENYRQHGYSEQQITLAKEALIALAIEMRLFSGAGQNRYHSLFVDKMHQSSQLKALKTCDLAPYEYKVKTESRWKHGGIDREFIIGPPQNPPKPKPSEIQVY